MELVLYCQTISPCNVALLLGCVTRQALVIAVTLCPRVHHTPYHSLTSSYAVFSPSPLSPAEVDCIQCILHSNHVWKYIVSPLPS